MKKLTALSAIALSIPTLFAQTAAPLSKTKTASSTLTIPAVVTPQQANNVSETHKQAINDFSNLPEATRLAFLKKRQEAGILFQNKRVIETLDATNELSEMFDRDPQVMNLRGACYVELRDFENAAREFEASMAITGPSVNVIFNIGEVAFISSNWKKSLELFSQAQELNTDKKSPMGQIIDFKIMLSHIALAKDTSLGEAEQKNHSDKVAEYAKLYSFLDDSPYYYYSQASLNYSKGDKEKGDEFVKKAHRIYANNPAALASWEDTLTEYGYLKSYYGNNSSQEQ